MKLLKDIRCSLCICRDCDYSHKCIYYMLRCGNECRYPYIICKRTVRDIKLNINIEER